MAEGPTPPAAVLDRLFRAYGDTWALRDLSLRLEPGRTLAVIGANGAGKSTLLRILAGLLRPTEGSVAMLGCDLPGEAWKLRGRVGYLGHQALLYRELTAAENLAFAAKLFGIGPEAARERCAELLERVDLADRATTRVGEMSAGMVQRLAICRTVLHRPEALLLDEPVAHLDPEGAETVAPLIAAEGRTRVLVTHDVGTALAEADRLLALRRDGSVAYEGAASALDPARARAFYADDEAGR